MKILFTIGNLGSGGAEKVIATLANNFIKRGHEAAVLMISEASDRSFYDVNKRVKVIPLLKQDAKYSIKKKTREITKFIESFKPDVVISFLNYVVVYTYFALKKCKNKDKIAFVVSERNNPKKVPENYPYRLLRNHIFKKADGCVFQTNEAKLYFKGIKKSSVIPNPVFVSVKPNRINITNDIIIVGSDKKEKNRSMAFKAYAIYQKSNPESKLIVVGGASNQKELSLISKLGIQDSVAFVGNQKNWHETYKNAKMFLLSSNYEGMPNALLEACALQIPCISTDCPSGGPKEILEDGKRGILVPVDDYEEMADQMLRLESNEDLYNHYSDVNRNFKDKYNEELISELWLNFIEQI